VVPSPVDKSVPRQPRDVQPVRDVLCGPVVSGHRGQGRPGEVVVQHLSEPVVAGEADIDQCVIEAGDGSTGRCQVVCVNTSREVSTDDGCRDIEFGGVGDDDWAV
jgi:hypothetical protein